MLPMDCAVNHFVDYIDHAYQGTLYYEMTRNFNSVCGPLRKPDSETVGVSMTISVNHDDMAYSFSEAGYVAASRRREFEIVVIFDNGESSSEVKFSIVGPNRLTEFLSVFACFMCLNNEQYLDSYDLFMLIPDKVDLSHIIRVIEIDHNVELLSRMIEDIYHYCRDGSYKEHIRAMLDHFTSTEHNDPELTAVILNKMHELDIVNEADGFYI